MCIQLFSRCISSNAWTQACMLILSLLWNWQVTGLGGGTGRVTHTKKEKKTETESSPHVFRADVGLVMLLIIVLDVGVRLHPFPLPPTPCLILSAAPFPSLQLLLTPSSDLTFPVQLPSRTSLCIALHSCRWWGPKAERQRWWGEERQKFPSARFLEIPHRTTVRRRERPHLCVDDWEVNNRCYIWDTWGDNVRRD